MANVTIKNKQPSSVEEALQDPLAFFIRNLRECPGYSDFNDVRPFEMFALLDKKNGADRGVIVSEIENTAKYHLANTYWNDEDNARKPLIFRYCPFHAAVEQATQNGYFPGFVYSVFYKARKQVWKIYREHPLYVLSYRASEGPLPLVSQVPRGRQRKTKPESSLLTQLTRRVRPKASFFTQLTKDITAVGRTLRRSELGQKIITFVRNFHKVAKSLSFKRKLWNGFIFSFSHSKFREKYGYSKAECNRLLNLAAGLGLITKVTPVEAKGIGEYWHKKFGVGILQFKLQKIDIALVKARWKKWLSEKIKVREITIKKIEAVMDVDITTHPEATNYKLREVVIRCIKNTEQQKQEREKKLAVVTEDPFDIGHVTYDIKPERKFTVAEAERIMADIRKDHDDHSMHPWQTWENFSRYSDISYYTLARGKRVVRSQKRISELPMTLMITEKEWKSSRKAARSMISKLYQQGLVGIITHSSLGNSKVYNWTYKYHVYYMRQVTATKKGY